MPEVPTNPDTLQVARSYIEAGLSVIPIQLDGSKQPAFTVLPRVPDPRQEDRYKPTWEPFKERLAVDEEIDRWFAIKKPFGIALVCGPVSGGLECLDLDLREVSEQYIDFM